MKRILITGANSFVGINVERWLMRQPDCYQVDTVDTMNDAWKQADFSRYDVVFHVAGIAHVDPKPEMAPLYYKVNRDLAIEVAKCAKDKGVKQFIYMSSGIVYKVSKSLKGDVRTPDTIPNPNDFYGDSKLQAEGGVVNVNLNADVNLNLNGDLNPNPNPNGNGDPNGDLNDNGNLNLNLNLNLNGDVNLNLNADVDLNLNGNVNPNPNLNGDGMKVCILRPPMIYGPGSKGNFLRLGWLATKTPVFPEWHNKRSMLYIDNLAEFVRQIIDREMSGTFFPQNAELVDTVEIVRYFAKKYHHRIWISRIFNPLVWLASFFLPQVPKMFADCYYVPEMSKYEFDYQIVSFEDSLKRLEITDANRRMK